MKKRMKKLASLCLSVSMVFSMFSVPVYASPADNEASEQTETVESTVTEDNAEASNQEVEEAQPQTTTVVETFGTYTVNAADLDVSDVTPYSVSVEGEVAVDESNPITTTIEEELGDIKVLNKDGESVALTEEQIQQILYVWGQYQDQCKANANLLGVQQPFFLSYNDNKDGLGVLGEMLVLAGYTVDQVRSGEYKFDDLMGMIQNFYYADKFGIQFYGDAIAAKREEAFKEVEKSGAKTMAQKMLVLNDWIAHQATFDMAYIMKGDTDGDGEQDDPLMVAENPQKHEHYDEIYNEMYALYEKQIGDQFRSQIKAGVEAQFRQQYYEAAIKNIVKQNCVDQGMSEEDAEAQAQAYMDANAEAISEDAAGFVESEFGPEAAAQLSAGADAFIEEANTEGVEVDPENAPGYKMTIDQIVEQQMDQPLDDLGGMTPNEAIPIYAKQAAEGLTQGILGAWEGNHIGILAEGTGVCAGYSKAFSYLLQYMTPEYYGVNGAGTDMSVAENWKTPEDLYYDEDGNIDIQKDYIVDMVRITFDASTSMFGETGHFGEVHFWNAVKVDGNWYYVDPCYADIYVECMNRDRVEIDGTMNHMYFLFSDSTAREMYDGNMKEIATLYEQAATDTTYEDSWFARVSSNAYSDGNNFYYLYDSTDQLSMMREFNSGSFEDMDIEALMGGADPDYKLVYHPITNKDEAAGADSDFTTLINFNPKDDDDNTLSAQVYDPASGEMVENELLTDLFAKYKEECDIYPSIKLTTALYNGKLYFNLSNCILSYEISSGNVSIVKEYDTVSGTRDNTKPFGGMAFTTCSEGEADFTFTNRPIAAMTIKEDGKMYVSIATNLGFISGKKDVNDISSYGYEYEESNYNPNYSNYTQDSDYSEAELEEMGFSKETNDNDEFMWSAVFVDTINMSGMCTNHSYESVTETFCGRDGYTENRCTTCGAVEDGSRVINEGTAHEHHYVHFEEQYYTKNDSGDWNSGDCYVCTLCGFSIEKPTEPKKNDQESEEDFEKRQAEYEKEKEIYDHAVETAGHTYEAEEGNVTWSEDNTTASVKGNVHCAVCENKKLDALGANAYDPKADANAANKVLSATLDNPVELTMDEESKTVSGTCDTGLTISYTAKGTTEDGKKIVAKKTETTEAGRHDYVAEFTWKDAEEEDAEIPYTATADIKCSACGDSAKGLEATVVLDEESSVAATCEEAGKSVYKATATYTKAEGEEPYTFEDSKVDEVKATGHDYAGEITWVEKTDEAGNGTGEWDATAVFTCKNNSEHKFEGDAVEVKVEKDTTEATCDKAGKVVYTATALVKGDEGKDIEPVTDSKEVEVPALGHKYECEFEWSDNKDYTADATAVFTCANGCGTKYEKDDVEVVVTKDEAESKAATCTEDGKNVYTATATVKGDAGKEIEAVTSEKHEVTIPATGHTYADDAEHAEWTWSEGHKEASLVLICTVCGTKTEAIKAEVEEKSSDATCTEAGTTVYKATAEYEGKTYTAEEKVTGEALGHDYKTEWKWSEAEGEVPHKATLTLTCSRCEDKQTVDGEVKLTSQKAVTCTEDGEDVYTATVTYDGKEYTDTHKDTYKATGHTYADDAEHAVWTWSEDHKEASLVLTCTTCGTATEAIKAEVEEKSTDATCTEAGTTTYKATAEYEGKTYTAEEKVTGEALGHDYKTEWKWSEAEGEVPHKATLTLTCSRCEDKQKLDGEVKLTSQKAVTCTEDGEDVYTATVTYDGKEYTDTHKDTYKATGHTYADDAEHAVWTWSEATEESETAYVASLVLKCTTCGTPTEAITAKVTEESTDATCTEAGTTVYTAKATHEDKEYTSTKTVTGEALGHNYKSEWKWTKVEGEDGKTSYTADLTLTCDRCDSVVTDLKPVVTVKSDVAATCTEDGETVYAATAEYEGKTYNSEKTVVNKATGHKFGEWEVEIEPTESSEGLEVRTCEVCGAREERSIGKESSVSVLYKTHIQTYGTEKEWKSNGELSGTSGEAKRLESIRIKLDNNGVYEGGIEYSTHVQREGWQDWKENGAMSGSEGSGLRLEAIKIRLTGDLAKHYDVYYAVHSQTYGWLNWAKNGEIAGTAGQGKRLEAIKIILVAKGGDAPEKIGTEDRCYVHYYVGYRTHVQTYGWQDYVYDGTMSGTSGESKRLEAINIKLMNQEYDGDIEYQTHVQTYGWETTWSKNGALSGTSGEAKRLEAIRIRLTDEMAEKYDVYYRVHAQYYGWLGWAKNGEEAGTAGFGKRLEGIEIVLVEKGGKAPGTTEGAFISNN